MKLHTFSRWYVFAGIVTLAAVRMEATPLHFPGTEGPTQFPDGTTITVYIPVDPNGLGRDADLAAGMLSWNNERPLLTHNIKIQVKPGQAPVAGAANTVQVNWVAPVGGTELGQANVEGNAGDNGNTTTGGTISIDPNAANVNKNEAKNLGIHEMGHMLGLSDSPNSKTAMDPDFNKSQTVKITDEDTLELFSTFAASNAPSSDHASTTVKFSGGLYEYDYTLDWTAGDALALFQVGTNGALLEDITAPSGWSVDPSIGDDVTTTMTGGHAAGQFLSFVLTDESSYLGPDHPELNFSFKTTAPPGEVSSFLNGHITTVGPVPEPGTLVLVGSALIAASLLKRRSDGA